MNPSAILSGPAGTATPVHARPTAAAAQTVLAAWFLDLPGSHPVWNCYALSVVHLRDTPGVPPAHQHYPEAQHELMLTALDPAPNPRADDVDTWCHLTPANIIQQFHELTDDQARELARLTAQALVAGTLPSEPTGIVGARELWRAFAADCVTQLVGGITGTSAQPSDADWQRAKARFDRLRQQYQNLEGVPGVNTTLALRLTFDPLARRYNAGERSRELYDEMQAIAE